MVSKTVQANVGDSVNYKVIKDGYKTVTSSIPITSSMPNVTTVDLETSSVIHNPQLNYSIDTSKDCAPIITFNDNVVTPDDTEITTNKYVLAPYGKDYLVIDNQQNDNFIRSGNVRIDENGFTNMSSSACMILEDRLENFNTFEIKMKIKTDSDVTTNQIYFCDKEHLSICSVALNVYQSKFRIYLSSNGSSWDIARELDGTYTVLANTWYYVKLIYNGTNYTFSYSLDDETYVADIVVNNSVKVIDFIPCLGSWYTRGSYFKGNIDINNVYIKKDNNIFWKPTWNKLYNNYNVYGSLLIKNGITQEACTSSNYLETIPRDFSACVSSSDTWEWVFKLEEYIPNSETIQVIYTAARSYETKICIKNHYVEFSLGNNGSSYPVLLSGQTQLQQGNSYWIKVEFTGSRYTVYLSTDGVNYTLDSYADSTTPMTYNSSDNWAIGYNRVNSYYYLMTSKLNLNECYIKINGKTWWEGVSTTSNNCDVIGNVTITEDKIAKNFSTSGYIKIPNFNPGDKNWEWVTKLRNYSTSSGQFIGGITDGSEGIEVRLTSVAQWWIGSLRNSYNITNGSTGTLTYEANVDYWIKITFDGTSYKLYRSTDGINYELDMYVNSTLYVYPYPKAYGLDYAGGGSIFNGCIYLSNCYIKVDNRLYWEPYTKIGEYLPGILDTEYVDTGDQVTLNLYDVEINDRHLVLNDTRNVNIEDKKFVEYDGQITIPPHMLTIYNDVTKTWEKYKNVTLVVNNNDTTIYTEGNG